VGNNILTLKEHNYFLILNYISKSKPNFSKREYFSVLFFSLFSTVIPSQYFLNYNLNFYSLILLIAFETIFITIIYFFTLRRFFHLYKIFFGEVGFFQLFFSITIFIFTVITFFVVPKNYSLFFLINIFILSLFILVTNLMFIRILDYLKSNNFILYFDENLNDKNNTINLKFKNCDISINLNEHYKEQMGKIGVSIPNENVFKWLKFTYMIYSPNKFKLIFLIIIFYFLIFLNK
jgi:hypothetical protein